MVEKLLFKISKLLSQCKIPYMVIGGQAVLLYGVARLTRDIDITLGVDTDSYETIIFISKKIGLKVLPKNTKRFVEETKVLPTEDRRSRLRVDFIFSNTPYERQALKRVKRIHLKGSSISFASLEDLIIHKMFAGRAIDLEDTKTLMAQHKGAIDIRYIRLWLKEFSRLQDRGSLLEDFDRIKKSA